MRLIDADALMNKVKAHHDIYANATLITDVARRDMLQTIIADIINAPTIEPSGDVVSREDVINAICSKCSTETRMDCALNKDFCFERKKVETLPSADRPKGEWIDNDTFIHKAFDCSKCGHITSIKTPFCSNCGAEMRGDAE